ncbi:MAG: hypothetical protein JWQ81_5853 [Amycolatopsis sp.]|jgi:hypothetical protein|nr:hypothetical protein [Amycolatopsis sp.]
MGPVVVRRIFVAAPALLLVGVLAMKFGWKTSPDLTWGVALPLWTSAHLAYILGYLGLGVVLATLWSWLHEVARGRVERVFGDVLAVVGTIGLVAMTGQMVLDLIVGFRAGSRAAMSGISDSIHAIPGFGVFFYGLIPALSLAAPAFLLVALAVRRRISAWPALTFLIGSLCIATGITPLMVAGGLAICVALPAAAGVTPPTWHRAAA